LGIHGEKQTKEQGVSLAHILKHSVAESKSFRICSEAIMSHTGNMSIFDEAYGL